MTKEDQELLRQCEEGIKLIPAFISHPYHCCYEDSLRWIEFLEELKKELLSYDSE